MYIGHALQQTFTSQSNQQHNCFDALVLPTWAVKPEHHGLNPVTSLRWLQLLARLLAANLCLPLTLAAVSAKKTGKLKRQGMRRRTAAYLQQ